MASVARAIEQAAVSSTNVDESLWWESHESLFHELDSFLCGPQKQPPNELVQKLEKNHLWLRDTLSLFKPPNSKSKSALDGIQMVLGTHTLEIKPDMKNIALELSRRLDLDEIQAYLLVNKFQNGKNFFDVSVLQKLTLKYYMERQCLLKCTRLLLLSHLAESTNIIKAELFENEIQKLAKGGLENGVFSVMSKLLVIGQPLHLDLDSIKLWAEETAMEISLVMDILFLIYYEPLCPCTFSRWSELFAKFQERVFAGAHLEKLSLTGEAMSLIQQVKHQALLIILEILDLDKLLLLVHDEVPISEAKHPFSISRLEEMGSVFAGLKVFEAQENAPLLLGWAVFGSLFSLLPGASENETDYSAYMQQSYDGGAFKYLLEMLQGRLFRQSIIDGYKTIVKSLLSAFVAAFDISNQADATFVDVLADTLYEIYSGQEMLCVEFWDRNCILDGPLRSLLFSLYEYFPYHLGPLVRLLAGLSEGPWPSECVYNFLLKMSDITSICYYQANELPVDDGHNITIKEDVRVVGAPGLLIPAGSCGQIIKFLDDRTYLVHWKCKHSALVIIILSLMDGGNANDTFEETQIILDLLYRMLMGNKMLAQLLLQVDNTEVCNRAREDGRMESDARVDILATIRSLLKKMLDLECQKPTAALCINILCVFTYCYPSKVVFELSKITPVQSQWGTTNYLEEGLIMKIFSKISKGLKKNHSLVLDASELCTVMLEKGMESATLSNMVIYIIGTSFVDHMIWGFSQNFKCWKTTAKVFELAIKVLHCTHKDLWDKVLELVAVDGSFHDVILKSLSTTSTDLEELYFNRCMDWNEIEWFQKSLCKGMQFLHLALQSYSISNTLQHYGLGAPLEHAILHHTVGTVPFVACVGSLINFFQNQDLQVASLKLLTALCPVAHKMKPHPISLSSFFDDAKICLGRTIGLLLSNEASFQHPELFDSVVDLIRTAAKYQPSLIDLLFSSKTEQKNQVASGTEKQCAIQEDSVNLVESICKLLKQGDSLFLSKPHLLSGILVLIKSLWEGCGEFSTILEMFRCSKGFWANVELCLVRNIREENVSAEELLLRSFQYQCQMTALQIMILETFLHQFMVLHDKKCHTSHTEERKAVHANGERRLLTNALPLEQWSNNLDPSQFLLSYACTQYDRSAILRAKAEMRALLVALMIKVLVNDERGLSTQLIRYLEQMVKAITGHPSFLAIISTYLSHGYGHGEELRVLVLNDLFFHLQGELEAGRHIPSGSFKELVEFLDTFELFSSLKMVIQDPLYQIELHSSSSSQIYDTSSFRQHLGMPWWSDNGSLAFSAAESTLDALQYANGIACIAASQLGALESLTNLLIVSGSNKHMVDVPADVKMKWAGSCIIELCKTIDHSIQLLGPDGDPTQYMPKFLAAQSEFLLTLVQWFSLSCLDQIGKIEAEKTTCKVVITVIRSTKSLVGSTQAISTVPELLVRSLLATYLICLEFILSLGKGTPLIEPKSMHVQDDKEYALSAFTLVVMESLPLLCLFVEFKDYAKLSIAGISILIKHFLSFQTWLPVLQTHFPVRSAVSLLQTTDDIDSSYQLLHLILNLSHSYGGIMLLQSASFFSHILVYSEQLKTGDGLEVEGPFQASNVNRRKNELWSLCVVIMAVAAHTVSEKNGGSVIENVFVFFESQKEQMKHTLQSPYFPNMDGSKRVKLQRPQTSLVRLQQTQQVLHLLIQLACHNAQFFEVGFTQNCIHLLAYIAREGLMRSINSYGAYVLCPPSNSDELLCNKKPSMINCNAGWFVITARGSFYKARDGSGLSDISSPASTEYSDLVALNIYKIAQLVLEFLSKQAQHLIKALDEGRAISVSGLPDFPAPEILYGLQDQATAIVTDICSKRSPMLVEDNASRACCILLSVMEKAVFLEICVARICGIGPLSMRSEDFSKGFKNLLIVVQGHHFLDSSMKVLKSIAGLAYPALF